MAELAALFAYLQFHPDRTALAVAVATLGNTAGGMTSYAIGRLVPPKELMALAFMATGRLARYIAVAAFSA